MKKFTLFLFTTVFFFCGKSFAQFNQFWGNDYQHTASLNFSNESRKVAVDNAGNVFVLADVTSDIDPSGITTTTTWHYTVLLKYSASGSLVHQNEIEVNNHVVSGFDHKGAFGLEVDAAGNVYAGYNYYDAGSNYDVRIAKFDNNLNLIWFQKYNPSTIDYGVDMKLSPSGTLYAIAQSFTGTNSQYHILKTDDISLAASSIYAFDVNADVINSLVLDASQNIYVTGYRTVSGFKNLLTAAVDNAGALIWKTTYNGGSSNRDDVGNNLVVGADGNIYVVGTSDRGAPTNNDLIILKYFAVSGKLKWEAIQNFANDNGVVIRTLGLNNLIVGSVSGNNVILDRVTADAGKFSGRFVYPPDPSEPHSALNGASLTGFKLSSAGMLYITGSIRATNLSAQAFSAAYLAKFSIDPLSRNVFKFRFEEGVGGDFSKSYSGVDLALDDTFDKVLWLRDQYSDYSNHAEELIKISSYNVPAPFKSAASTVAASKNEISIYPVPADKVLTFSSGQGVNEKVEIIITDIAGKVCLRAADTELPANLDISGLESGIYTGKVFHESGEVSVLKIIKN